MKNLLSYTLKRFLIIWIILFAAGTMLTFRGISHESLWYDESYTAAMTNHTVAEIVRMSAGDYHPPLFYVMARMFRIVFGNSEFALRTLSALGLLALAALSLGPVRRIFGKLNALIFTVLVFVTPVCISTAQDARMYTWACLFVTAGVLYGYLAVTEGKRSDWLLLGLYTVLAVYTHFYALLEMVVLYGLLVLWGIFGHRKAVKRMLITSVIVGAACLPWVWVLAGQAAKVSKEFWVPSPNALFFFGTFIYPFGDKFSIMAFLPFILLSILAALILTGKAVCQGIRRFSDEGKAILLMCLVLLLTVVATLVISFMVKPIFYPRYFFTVLGLYLLVVMYGIGALQSFGAKVAVCAALAVFAFPQLSHTCFNRVNGPMFEAVRYLQDKVQPGDMFLHNCEQPFGTFIYYFPQHRHYLNLPEGFEGYADYAPFRPNGTTGHDYRAFVRGKTRVWLVNRRGLKWVKFRVIPESALTQMGFRKDMAATLFQMKPAWYQFTVTGFINMPEMPPADAKR
ncbi:MAG: glycosyltransferase family 39 protein [Deltaproteobacteria bacterium]|nr:glycosyltransferase family 39 protein [Deltaproteobacteria bacterium]